MPQYDFKCNNEPCGKTFDQSFSSWKSYEEARDRHELVCPSCASRDVEKLISQGTSAQFKGSGFYVNDYPKRGRK